MVCCVSTERRHHVWPGAGCKFAVAPQLARTGEGGEQQDHTQKQCSEKCGGGHRSTQATYAPEARFFGPQTPETPAVSFSPCPLSCKGLGRFSKLATS